MSVEDLLKQALKQYQAERRDWALANAGLKGRIAELEKELGIGHATESEDPIEPDVVVTRKLIFGDVPIGRLYLNITGQERKRINLGMIEIPETGEVLVCSPYEPVLLIADEDGWYQWSDGECPVPRGKLIKARLRSGTTEVEKAVRFRWWHGITGSPEANYDIVAFRLHKQEQPSLDSNIVKHDDQPIAQEQFPADEIRAHVSVHASHCCKEHGCKYNDDNCPVAYGDVAQKRPCEACRDNARFAEGQKQLTEGDVPLFQYFIRTNGTLCYRHTHNFTVECDADGNISQDDNGNVTGIISPIMPEFPIREILGTEMPLKGVAVGTENEGSDCD